MPVHAPSRPASGAGSIARAAATVGGVLFAASVLIAGPGASATQGSVPLEVTEYAKHGLVVALNDVFGVGGTGAGIDFDETTTTGPISRVFGWTEAYAAGEKTGTPVELLNQWVTTISINEKVMGLATIWINEATVQPELAAFDRGLAIGTAFLDLPAEATLVRDDSHGAWFTLADGELTAVEPGTSGITSPTTIAAYQHTLVAAQAREPVVDNPHQGLLFGEIAVAAVVLLTAAWLYPRKRRTLAAKSAPAEEKPKPTTKPTAAPKSTTKPAPMGENRGD